MPMRKIVADSSADTLLLAGVDFASVPLTIMTNEREYVDNATLDVAEMCEQLLRYNGRSSTACPGVGDWLAAFGDAEEVFCVTITSNLSGSHNAAVIAAQEYEESHPGRRVFVVDSLSTGPEMRLLLERLQKNVMTDMAFEAICADVTAYSAKTGLLFVLESMKNLANNGRVSRLAATAAGLLGIRAVGKASDRGTLEMLEKCRGEQKALAAVVQQMREQGYIGGAVRISHVGNEEAAQSLREMLAVVFPKADIRVYAARGLCSFYAEKGGLLIGFEKG